MLSYCAPPEYAAPFLYGLRPSQSPFRVFRPLRISGYARGYINPDQVCNGLYLMEKFVENRHLFKIYYKKCTHMCDKIILLNIRILKIDFKNIINILIIV